MQRVNKQNYHTHSTLCWGLEGVIDSIMCMNGVVLPCICYRVYSYFTLFRYILRRVTNVLVLTNVTAINQKVGKVRLDYEANLTGETVQTYLALQRDAGTIHNHCTCNIVFVPALLTGFAKALYSYRLRSCSNRTSRVIFMQGTLSRV